MTENDADSSEQQPAGDGVDAQLSLVRSLATENSEAVERLRGVQIPQHVGMAAAARALAGYPEDRSIAILQKTLRFDEDAGVRDAAAQAMEHAGVGGLIFEDDEGRRGFQN